MPQPRILVPDRWSAREARSLTETQLLRYRSNLLGFDKRITNYGGGNTSVKVRAKDPLTGKKVEVLWVKGSGGDLGTMGMDGFATLYMDKLEALKDIYPGPEREDEMAGLLAHCTFNLNPRAASIDTPLHAFVPYRHVDHMHPDSIIAIAASRDSKKLTRAVFGDSIGWLPWRRPGFELGLWIGDYARSNPHARGVVLESHGLFTWDNDARECYRLTLDTINRAIKFFAAPARKRKRAFGGAARKPLAAAARREAAASLMPRIRGLVSAAGQPPKVGHFTDVPDVLEFIDARGMDELARQGTSCPDHFLRTKIRPLIFPTCNPSDKQLASALAKYRRSYAAYYRRNSSASSPPMRDANAVVYLVPQVGMITFAADRQTSRLAAEYYINAINVMRGASAVSTYCGLPEREAFNIEYWQLEEAKLKRRPKPKLLAGRTALVTGGAGAIGKACAARLLADDCCVMICDISEKDLEKARKQLSAAHGSDRVRAQLCDVRSEEQVKQMMDACSREFGGLDMLVSNAGISAAAPLEETSLDLWNANHELMATGYFLVSREAYRLMLKQGIGGSVVFIASKNGVAASAGASAYCSAKAAEVHLARCIALEGAAHGIRANVVNPDAVLVGSKIWSGSWRRERAKAYGIKPDELDGFYRNRSLLKRSVYAEDVAEAVWFLGSDLASKTTGTIVAVDAGNPAAFGR